MKYKFCRRDSRRAGFCPLILLNSCEMRGTGKISFDINQKNLAFAITMPHLGGRSRWTRKM
jgi:hypothetical protein